LATQRSHATVHHRNIEHFEQCIDWLSGTLPQFDHQWVPSLGVGFVHPLTESILLTLSANIYSFREIYTPHSAPDQWNITIGVSTPLDKLASTFKSLIGQ